MSKYQFPIQAIDPDEALCTTTDPNAFFEEASDNAQSFAIRLCGKCPVKKPCLEVAMNTPYLDDYGVWGGTTRAERRRLRIARNKAANLSRGNNNDPHHTQGETN